MQIFHLTFLLYRGQKEDISELSEQASKELKKVGEKTLTERDDRRSKKESRAKEEAEREIPMDLLREYLNQWWKSVFRRQRYELLGIMENAVKRLTATEIRDFLILETLISGAGQRGDVVRNMRISQLYNAKAVATKAGEEAEELYAISVTEHKTAKGRGAIEIMVPRSLRNLLIKFEREVRHLLAPMSKKIDDYLFVTNDTGEMMTRVDSAVGIFRKEVGCVNIMTAKSFRQYFATKAQNSDDPITRERMPIHMGHSQNTVQTYYLRRPERCRSMYKCLKKLVA